MIDLIGITGKARSGKDTLANILVNSYGYKRYAFADPLKKVGEILFGWNEEHSDGQLKENIDPVFGISPRQFYQTFGTDFARQTISDDIWIKILKKSLIKNKNVVISDVRFDNEAEFVLSNGGIILHIEREDRTKLEAVQANHLSEDGISGKFYENSNYIFIDGNGTKEELTVKVHNVMENILTLGDKNATTI